VTGCGARTGLPHPCEVPLERVQPTIILLLDHGNGLDDDISDSQYVFWDAEVSGVRAGTALVDGTAHLGVLVSPDCIGMECNDLPAYCQATTMLGIEPRPNNAARVLAYISSFPEPVYAGGQPAAGAFDTLIQWFSAHPSHPAFVVFENGGGADCNADIAEADCDCGPGNGLRCWDSGAMPGQPPVGSIYCNDTPRVITRVLTLRAMGVETVVIAENINDGTDYNVELVNQMSVAGGRPLPAGPRRFYDIESIADANVIYRRVLGELTYCVARSPELSFDRDRVALMAVGIGTWARDPTHTNGWDWLAGSTRDLQLYGDACAQAATGVELRFVTLDNLCW
jgi:hypothetical protein